MSRSGDIGKPETSGQTKVMGVVFSKHHFLMIELSTDIGRWKIN